MNKIIDNVNRARQGDQDAISELYYTTYPKIRSVAVTILKNENDADDIVQDSYIKAFSNIHQLDDANKFEAWLCRIVSNKCKDYLKKKKPILFSEQTIEIDSEPVEWRIEDESKEFNPEEFVISEDTRNQLMELLDSLPDEQRICLLYFAVYEMKITEIADLLEVSENTVKSRLRYAERKMRDKIEELEKKGIKIRSFTGLALLPFLKHLFTTDAKAASSINSSMILEGVKETSKNVVSESIHSAISDVGVQTTKTVAGNVVRSLGIKGALSGVAGKIIAGVLAVSVTIVGIGVHKHIQSNNAVAEAYKLYEELLSSGKTESGMDITHYAYVDLGSDGMPELLVSDSDIIPETISGCECFTIKDNQVYSFGHSGAYYDYIYLINGGEYIAGRSRMGRQFINVDESMQTTSYKWDKAITRNDPAISHNDGEWEYITKEEFDYYNTMPDNSKTEGFIKSAEIIKFKENIFSKQDANEDYFEWNGEYSGGGVKDGQYVIGQWHATISNTTEKAINLSLSISESDFYIEDATLYKQEDGSYYGRGVTIWGDEQNIKVQMESSNCIFVTVITIDTGYKDTAHLYKE